MKKELGMEELESVTGGSVIITNTGLVAFSTLGVKTKLKEGVNWRTARNYAEELLDSNPQMTAKEFDEFVMNKFQDKHWI